MIVCKLFHVLERMLLKKMEIFSIISCSNQLFWDCVIHERGFVHRDIKWHNVILLENRFGKKVGIEREKRKLRGTPMYMTLESVLDGEYGTAVDIWAFGSAMFETITGKKIWDCTGINDTLHLFCKFGM
ncbi:putative mitogen-activated protein kinase kinase kinase NPK1-like [Capsicum annuum]|nr:putative mitogen-activated protein kinase kinase kinase NPK1-like [Capsicum annuum]